MREEPRNNIVFPVHPPVSIVLGGDEWVYVALERLLCCSVHLASLDIFFSKLAFVWHRDDILAATSGEQS